VSERSVHLPRRSVLSVPASSERFLEKAPQVPADMILLDLEDGVAPGEKADARRKVVEAIRELAWNDRVLCVRLNAWDSEHTLRDVQEVVGRAGERLDEVMLPKAESAAQVVALDLVLTQVERECGLPPGRTGIEVQIESAEALAHVGEICRASRRLEAVVLGPADLAASLQMPTLTGGEPSPRYPGDVFHFALASILVAARAAGIQAIDGPYLRLGDFEGLRVLAERSFALGYDGKWAIHPDQVPVLNEVFTPSQEDFDRAHDVVVALDRAAAVDGRGAVRFAGEMIDEATRKMALKVVARGRLAGLERSPREPASTDG